MSITGSLFFFSFFVFNFFMNNHHYSNHNSNIFKLFDIVFCFKKTIFLFSCFCRSTRNKSVYFSTLVLSHMQDTSGGKGQRQICSNFLLEIQQGQGKEAGSTCETNSLGLNSSNYWMHTLHKSIFTQVLYQKLADLGPPNVQCD